MAQYKLGKARKNHREFSAVSMADHNDGMFCKKFLGRIILTAYVFIKYRPMHDSLINFINYFIFTNSALCVCVCVYVYYFELHPLSV